MINTYLIWSLLSFKEKRTFVFLLFFGIVILLLEILSIGSIFPIVYSINDKKNSIMIYVTEQNSIHNQVIVPVLQSFLEISYQHSIRILSTEPQCEYLQNSLLLSSLLFFELRVSVQGGFLRLYCYAWRQFLIARWISL